ncbi:unnamed protein product [Cuscuta campestris]|uniref:SHSP domain-containing protein n=1 Tax=Cuscuta campestris TaxID=132261 RepID=A0A484MGZ1_9ASTE|nr:unnamed protein product [Cuscuta campestris]
MDISQSENDEKRTVWKKSKKNLKVAKTGVSHDSPQEVELEGFPKKRRHEDNNPLQLGDSSHLERPCVMPLVPLHNLARSSKASVILSGTACKGATGPPIGALDIGLSKSAYYFRIALPGVKKGPGEFKCEIERDGKVHIRGVTSTGEKVVSRYSRVFQMKFQEHCPPGAFTLFFSLPGPVDPRLFSPNFRSDGIFEAVVMKYEP